MRRPGHTWVWAATALRLAWSMGKVWGCSGCCPLASVGHGQGMGLQRRPKVGQEQGRG